MIRRILLGLAGLFALAVIALVVTLSNTSGCPEVVEARPGDGGMMAVIRPCYGPPEVLSYTRVQKPVPGESEILVRVEAAAINPLDSHFMRGTPYLLRLLTGLGAPDDARLGRDFAGTVVAVGDQVNRFKPGDRVFGGADGAFAEYLVRAETGSVALLPEEVDFDQAAALPIAGITALQALRDHGTLQPDQRVLINGASGGVGTYAVQIAKSMGAHVTGVCSGRNVDMVRRLGADEVIDYGEQNYVDSGQRFDLIVDMVGNHSPWANRRVLTEEGKLVIVGGAKGDWIAPLMGPLNAAIANLFVEQELMSFTAQIDGEDLAALANMMAAGIITTRIDRRAPLSETAEAIRYLETRRARGKVIIQPGADASGRSP